MFGTSHFVLYNIESLSSLKRLKCAKCVLYTEVVSIVSLFRVSFIRGSTVMGSGSEQDACCGVLL